MKTVYGMILLILMLAGCATTPPTQVHQPTTARPVDRTVHVPADGAIFHAGVHDRPLFEDRRARNVGDLLTVTIAENVSGSRESTNDRSYARNTDANIPTVSTNIPDELIRSIPIVGSPVAGLLNKLFSLTGSASGSTNNSASREVEGAASNDLSGTITVTVIEVLPNGNLLVSGEKSLSLNHSDEYIRLSGVVNPMNIDKENTVLSTRIADARIEYRSAGAMNEVANDARTLGFLGRFFLSVLPF